MNSTPLLELLSHMAMKGAAVLLVALLLGLILLKMAASRRYAIWITAIAALAVLPLAMWALPAWRVLPKASAGVDWPMLEPEIVSDSAEPSLIAAGNRVTLPAPKTGSQVPAQVETRQPFSWINSWQDVVSHLPLAWLLITGWFLLRLGLSAWRLRRLEATLIRGESAMLEQTARDLGLQRMPRLFIGPQDSVPMVWGVLNPRLLLPQGFETWSREKQRGVLLHELAHLKRGDPLALWVAQWVKALHWFNPLAWLTLHQLRADQERACDDTVLRHGVRASDYAQSLLDLSRHNRLAPGLSLCALTITRCAPVEARVKAILDPKRHREALTLRWLAGLAACALLITLPVAMLHAIEGPTLRGRILDRNGVVLAESTKEKVRNYPLKTLAAHMIGYARGPDEEHAQLYGGAGSEKQQNAVLAAGKDVALTLDMRIQSLAYQAMSEVGVTRGAAVVMDPRTGEILAAVSLPSYDLNLFAPSITQENWDQYLGNRDYPLLNRCLASQYAPGDAFTPLTALAAISKGLGDKTFNCRPATTSYQSKFECLQIRQGGKGHGTIGLEQALQNSCRHYWCQLGMLAGFDAFGKLGKDIGFGQKYGLLDAELPGVLPTQEWWEKRRQGKRAWSDDNTADLAEGYGYANVTPLQMAVLAATVANSGRVPQPILTMTVKTGWRADLIKEDLPAAQIEKLREGMRLVVNSDSGTAQSARSTKVMIAGKNGATKGVSRTDKGELVEKNNSWFIGFAPFDQPTLAFAILNQGGKTVGDCAPIAKRIVEEALALPADGSGEVQPVGDALGIANERRKQAHIQFDAKADALRTAFERIKPDAATGFKLDEFMVRNGQVLIRGSASGMIQALQFRDKVAAIALEEPLEWTFPVPQTLKDGQRVGFEALGVLVWKEKTTTSLEDVQVSLVTLNDRRSNVWEEVRKTARLAEIPGRGVAMRGESGDPAIHFYLLRKDAAGWLRSSFGAQVDVGWLETGAPKNQRYPAKNGYEIEVTPMESPTFLKVTVKALEKTAAAAPAKFDFNAGGETSRQIKALSAETGILVKEFKMGGGKVSILGEASDEILARKYLFKLLEIGKERNVRWALPTTKALENQSVQFEASGTYGAEALHGVTSDPKVSPSSKPASQAQLPISDDVFRMKPGLAKQWEQLKKTGLLADLPAEAQPFDTGESEERRVKSRLEFRFDVSRAAGHRWLLSTVYRSKNVDEASLHWPEPPEAFQRTYEADGHCSISILSSDGERLIIIVSQQKPSILIAPDEFQEPRPAGKLAPNYKQEGFTLGAPKAPTLNPALQHLLSTISQEEALCPRAWWLPPDQIIYLQTPVIPSYVPKKTQPAPLHRLAGELSAESEAALLRSSQSGSRMQQALLVTFHFPAARYQPATP